MVTVFEQLDRVPVLEGCRPDALAGEVFAAGEPLVLKGLVQGWPAVRGCESVASARAYLARFWCDKPVTVYVGHESINGRFFYNEDCTGFNFKSGTATLTQVFDRLGDSGRSPEQAAIYIGSTPIDQWLPGFGAENGVRLPVDTALASFWLGSKTRISAHYDFPDNLACVVAGHRRFTLFPPEQISNLYVGPLEKTPSGQAISLVDFHEPDFDRFPGFAEALRHGKTCELAPGDAIFIPSMWWHHVEALGDFNLLINYWWCTSPAFMGSPTNALMHAILALRDLPPRQRRVWRRLFEYYVFAADEAVYGHIPEQGRGWLQPLDDAAARKLRAEVMNRLNR